jgi:hypothetical protein
LIWNLRAIATFLLPGGVRPGWLWFLNDHRERMKLSSSGSIPKAEQGRMARSRYFRLREFAGRAACALIVARYL